MRQKLCLITLGVNNLEKALDFYEKGLGWKKSSASQGDIAFFQLGGIVLSLYPRNLLAKDATVEDKGEGFSGITISHNTRSEQEVEDVLMEVEKLGATIVKKAEKVFWGGYSGYFTDPDGHLYEVAFNPYWKFDDNDNVMLPD